MAGYDFNMNRYANWGPPTNPPYQTPPVQLPDTPGYNACYNFGSAHLVGFNMALCDGSVRMISYSIDMMTHIHLANRHDGFAIDPKSS